MSEVRAKPTFLQKIKDKNKAPKSKARKIIEWVLFGIFAILFGLVLAGNISAMVHKKENYGQSIRFGIGSFVVLTNSMEPDYPVNSAIITYKENAENVYNRFNEDNSQIIDMTFMNIYPGFVVDPDTPEFKAGNGGQAVVTNAVMTHRLREVHIDTSKNFGEGRYIFITAGINPGGQSSAKGQYQVFTEQHYLGVVKHNSVFLGKAFNFVASPIGLILLLLIPAFYLIISSAIDIYKVMGDDEPATSNSSNISNISEKDKERLKRELLQEMLEKSKKGDDKDA